MKKPFMILRGKIGVGGLALAACLLAFVVWIAAVQAEEDALPVFNGDETRTPPNKTIGDLLARLVEQ